MHPQRKFYSPLWPTPLLEMVRTPKATTEMNCYCFIWLLKKREKKAWAKFLDVISFSCL